MVAQQAATLPATTRKPSQTPVLVNVVDLYAGTWTALSSNGTGWYHIDLKAHTCDCPAGAHGFKNCRAGVCKHVVACSTIARTLASMTREARADALRIKNVWVKVDKLAVTPAPARPVPTFAEIAEAFAALPPLNLNFRQGQSAKAVA